MDAYQEEAWGVGVGIDIHQADSLRRSTMKERAASPFFLIRRLRALPITHRFRMEAHKSRIKC